MSDAKESWDQVSAKASSLGTKLKAHFEAARADEWAATDEAAPAADATASDTTTSGAAGDATAEPTSGVGHDVKESLRKLSDAIDDAFGAVGHAVKDQSVKDDLKGMGSALADALSSTLTQVGGEVKKVFNRKADDEGSDAEPAPWTAATGGPPPPAPGTTPPTDPTTAPADPPGGSEPPPPVPGT